MFILIDQCAANSILPRTYFSLFFSFLQYVYLNLLLINRAVLSTKWKWVIISNGGGGGDVNHRRKKERKK